MHDASREWHRLVLGIDIATSLVGLALAAVIGAGKATTA